MRTLVLTAIGEDRPGLVAALAAAVDQHGGNWVDSQLALLAGQFAGIVQVDLPVEAVEDFQAALTALAEETGLRVEASSAHRPAASAPAEETLHLRLVGQDRTGMVREVTAVLTAQGATIDALRSWTREAPEGGGVLFEAEAEIRAAAGTDTGAIRDALEAIAAELMVDVELDSFDAS